MADCTIYHKHHWVTEVNCANYVIVLFCWAADIMAVHIHPIVMK